MFRSLLKVLPVLTMGLAASTQAQEIAAQPKAMKSTTMQTMPCGIIENDNCLARSCTCAMGGALEFDFLYWRAENRGFTYAYEQKNPSYVGTTPFDYNIGSLVRLESEWKPGFRIGAGWNTDYDRWDVFADWTWYRARSSESSTMASPTNNMGFYPMWPTDNSGLSSYQKVQANWHMWHNAIDLELGRAFYLTKSLTLRPHWGLRGGWINQKFRSTFTQPFTALLLQNDFHGKNNFWGIGPRMGLHSHWYIANSNWSILGKVSASLLCGETKVRYLTETIATAGTVTTERSITDRFSQLVPNLQLFLGLDWGSCLHCNKYYLGINAGWEANIYWNQFDIPAALRGATAPLAVSNGHPVTMEGLTVNLHLDY